MYAKPSQHVDVEVSFFTLFVIQICFDWISVKEGNVGRWKEEWVLFYVQLIEELKLAQLDGQIAQFVSLKKKLVYGWDCVFVIYIYIYVCVCVCGISLLRCCWNVSYVIVFKNC